MWCVLWPTAKKKNYVSYEFKNKEDYGTFFSTRFSLGYAKKYYFNTFRKFRPLSLIMLRMVHYPAVLLVNF